MKWIRNAVLIVIFILCASAIAFYVFQNKLIFQAEKLPADYHFVFNQPFEEYRIPTPDGNTINAIWFKPAREAKGLVIYFHGNADHLQRWGHYAADITRLGYEVLMMDYRGYGKSSGTPSEKLLYEDATLIWRWAKEHSGLDHIVIYGRSLGSAVATHLATEVQPSLLILETPFDELKGASILRYLYAIIPLHTKFATKDFIENVSCKIVIFQGTNDWVVSLKSAERLKSFLKETDEFIVIPEGGHYNLNEFELYHSKLAEVLR
jgi:alpha-beta hydrolase superfamily lysophospholipase